MGQVVISAHVGWGGDMVGASSSSVQFRQPSREHLPASAPAQ
jgi:hypothetical protein